MRPQATPSLADDASEFAALVEALWSGDTGAGRVIASTDVEAALVSAGVAPAFHFTGGSSAARIPFVEREWDGGRLFFLSNPGAAGETIEARFRVTGKVPELWDSVTGTSSPVSYLVEGGETVIPLTLASDDSIFVVFREDSTATGAAVAEPGVAVAASITSPWTVSFQEGRRGPATMQMSELVRWDESADPALRYFSGVASYANSFTAPRGWARANRCGSIWARFTISPKSGSTASGQEGLWRAPWRIDVGALAHSGSNTHRNSRGQSLGQPAGRRCKSARGGAGNLHRPADLRPRCPLASIGPGGAGQATHQRVN